MRSRVNEEVSCRRLEIFLVYMRCGSLASAGAALDVSPVSVHRALHALEEGMRCSLFRHEGRRLIPNEAAQVLVKVAEDVVGRLERGIEATRQAAGYSADRLRIGSLYSLTSDMLPALIKSMEARKPDVHCELILGRSKHDLLPKLQAGSVDAVYSEIPAIDAELVCLPMFDDDVFFAAPLGSAYARQDAIELSQCAGERMVALRDSPFASGRLHELYPEFAPTLVMEVEDIFALLNLVASGFAYALVPGRIRGMFQHNVTFIPLRRQPGLPVVRQTIGLCFLRARERDPNLLALSSVSRLFALQHAVP
jgi:LysR family transcriptional regulator, malonate utilization transcriptional regulator